MARAQGLVQGLHGLARDKTLSSSRLRGCCVLGPWPSCWPRTQVLGCPGAQATAWTVTGPETNVSDEKGWGPGEGPHPCSGCNFPLDKCVGGFA